MFDSLGFALAVIIAEITPAGIGLYAVYWAFSIRRALAGPIYRNHALWLGAVCVLFALSVFLTYSTNAIISEAFNVFFAALVLVLFAFIDSSVRLARRSDPLLRSVFRWEKLRIVLWIEIALFDVITVFFYGYAPANPVFILLFIVSFVMPFAAGGPALLIAARRSRDPVLRVSLRWLGIVLLMVVVGILESFVVSAAQLNISQFSQYYSYPAIPGGVISIVIAYAFYRSARSLAPINRLQAVEPETIPAPSTLGAS